MDILFLGEASGRNILSVFIMLSKVGSALGLFAAVGLGVSDFVYRIIALFISHSHGEREASDSVS